MVNKEQFLTRSEQRDFQVICLIDLKSQVSAACASEVRRIMITRAKSIDLMPQIQEGCTYDLTMKCSNVENTKKGEVSVIFKIKN